MTLLGLLFVVVIANGIRLHEVPASVQTVSAITKLPPPALSAQFLEPRFRVYRDYRVHLYPKALPIDYLGFVYAK